MKTNDRKLGSFTHNLRSGDGRPDNSGGGRIRPLRDQVLDQHDRGVHFDNHLDRSRLVDGLSIYSPDFTLVEQHLGITNGVFGLPEGVLPTPSHDHVVGFNGTQSIPWYMVTVLVFDPNIMPNAVTGKSDLSNPTVNCLNSLSAIQAALATKTAATANANATQNDPIYDTFGGVQTQVLVPGVTAIAETSPANSNLFLYFNVVSETPYN